MINALNLKLCILQSSGEIKELKDRSNNSAFVTLKETSLTPTRNIFFIWIKSCQTSLHSLCSYFFRKDQRGALRSRSTITGVTGWAQNWSTLSKRTSVCSRGQISQTAAWHVPCTSQYSGMRGRAPSLWEVSLFPQGQLTFKHRTGGQAQRCASAGERNK